VWDRIGKRLIPSSAGETSLSGIFRTASIPNLTFTT
jgi:hypothetical protein